MFLSGMWNIRRMHVGRPDKPTRLLLSTTSRINSSWCIW